MKAGERIRTTVGRITFNRGLPDDYPYINHEMDKKGIGRIVEDCSVGTRPRRWPPILDELKRLGFHYATRAGVTVSVYDAMIPEKKPEILAAADEAVTKIEGQYEDGLITHDERHRQIVEIWTRANEDVGDAMGEAFDKFNPIYMMAYSGSARKHQADPPVGWYARPHGEPEGRHHRPPDQGELPRGPHRSGVLHLHARRPQGSR